ncbi:MAG TPA: hypothetical protein VHP81_13975 [Lachnospiraceae bacterium]|nr:hypothetical protein [Lachnospiraceae bacterium]
MNNKLIVLFPGGKSIGTVIAGWVEEKLALKVGHIFLTPIDETFPYIGEDKNILRVIVGSNDRVVSIQNLKDLCIR